jgi:hypothetical protein
MPPEIESAARNGSFLLGLFVREFSAQVLYGSDLKDAQKWVPWSKAVDMPGIFAGLAGWDAAKQK